MRPFHELDLRDELRLDPDHVALSNLRHLRHLAERRLVAPQGTQQVEQLLDLLAAEAGADVARVDELAARVVAEHERPEARCAPARALRVAGHDEFLLGMCLDLEPVTRPLARQVTGIEPLGDDPLEVLLLCSLEQRLAVVERLGQPHRLVPAIEELLQQLAALDEWQVDDRFALDLEHVEDVVDDRRFRLALLHRGEARAAGVVERAHLAVEHAVRRLHRLGNLLGDVREPCSQVVAVSARERDVAAGLRRDRPVAVPLDLERSSPLRGARPARVSPASAARSSGFAARPGLRRPGRACGGSASSSRRRSGVPARATTSLGAFCP